MYLHFLDALLSDGKKVVVKTTDRQSSVSNIVDTDQSSPYLAAAAAIHCLQPIATYIL